MLAATCVWAIFTVGFATDGQTEPTLPAASESKQAVNWLTEYDVAMRQAKTQKKMLLVWFYPPGEKNMVDITKTAAYKSAKFQEQLARYTCVKLPTDASIIVGGKSTRLLGHAAFRELAGGQGIAIIDLANEGESHYGYVVSAVPFARGKYYAFRSEHLPVLVDLPPGTLTQRTKVFAVRIHPEQPASTLGAADEVLMKEAASHSSHQARIGVQGHHQWDSRFHRISRMLPSGLHAQEVVAESWPGERLVDACVDCVASWRHSSGHWSAVRGRQPRFGYDIRLGRNGIWYATGLFGNRR